MLQGIVYALGGLGLFLLGMATMTDGLKRLTGRRLRSLLARSTKSPLSGAITGMLSTAVVQSSSATTVAAVGFVAAGLLTFPQSLGILFGANIGTTITGWFVALLGIKLNLAEFMLPCLFVGMLLRLFGRGRLAATGFALAGFSVILLGISLLQEGMQAFHGVVTPETFPEDSWSGRLRLVLLGIVITLITQSSSAGVAAALTAVNAGTITLAQAAAMVIGMDVGTTVTALLATVGGTTQSRRTGLAHVLYNLLTAILALCLLTPYLRLLDAWVGEAAIANPELSLVGFHTFFNTLGVIAVLPFTRQFATLIERLVPERGNPLIERLDRSLISTPDVAMQAAEATVHTLMESSFAQLSTVLRVRGEATHPPIDRRNMLQAWEKTSEYIHQVGAENVATRRRQVACLHILDHLRRLVARTFKEGRLEAVYQDSELVRIAEALAEEAEQIAKYYSQLNATKVQEVHTRYLSLKRSVKPYRQRIIEQTIAGDL